ncbi:MAG: hypothetical protein R2848_05175 [Thermomicrobiales bacterium]
MSDAESAASIWPEIPTARTPESVTINTRETPSSLVNAPARSAAPYPK